MSFSPLIDQLIQRLQCLPGVGPKSAQRMGLHLLTRNREGGVNLAYTIQQAMNEITHCQQCRILCETPLCRICNNTNRDHSSLCIVETPADVMAIEQTATYRGIYFVLLGHLSPLDDIGPQQLGMDQLENQFAQKTIREVILATNSTVEGEATAHYIAQLTQKYNLPTSRIAYGIPMGGELEYLDSGTLARALNRRENLNRKTLENVE